MIAWTNLLTGQIKEGDSLRYSKTDICVPKILVWNLTSHCNLKCQHCYFDAKTSPDSGELNLAQAKSFIDDLSYLKLPVLLFSGGEPLLRQGLFELGEYAISKGIRSVLSTNGTLITKKIAKRIKKVGFSYAGISIDGLEETNDLFRKKKGAFKEAIAGVRNCHEFGIKVGLRFTLTRYNHKDLPQIFDLLEKESIKRICIYHLVYSGRGDDPDSQDLSVSERLKAMNLIWDKTFQYQEQNKGIEILTVDNHADGVWLYLRLRNKDPQRAEKVFRLLKRQGGNSSGMRIGSVDNFGNVYPDQFWRSHCLGNVLKEKFSQIWSNKNNKFLNDLRNRKLLLKGKCQKCAFKDICNGSFRARAEAVSGDPWTEDPACYLSEEEILDKQPSFIN
tara:strand:+ start:443 stop:1612 length:1170 start_codon:yes stop_codon:yes gene_type:complete